MEDGPEILLSSAYLPNIQYFSKLLSGKKVAIEVHDNYQKQSFRNRTVILSANGPLNLVIPVIKTNGNNTRTRDILIDYEPPWQQVHWKAIVSAYKHSPFFEIFEEELRPVFLKQEKYLLDWNFYILRQIFKISGIEEKFTTTLEYASSKNEMINDFRETIHPKSRLQKDDPFFRQESYLQVFGNKFKFVPNLSYIDLLFNEGPDAAFLCRKCFYQEKGQ